MCGLSDVIKAKEVTSQFTLSFFQAKTNESDKTQSGHRTRVSIHSPKSAVLSKTIKSIMLYYAISQKLWLFSVNRVQFTS